MSTFRRTIRKPRATGWLALVTATTSICAATWAGCSQAQRAGPPVQEPTARDGQDAPQTQRVDLASLTSKTVLLVSHPSVSTVKNLESIIDGGMLDVPDLFVVGMYHGDEIEDYTPARRYLHQHGITWMGLYELDCELSRDALFATNGCSDAFRGLFDVARGVIVTGGPDIPPWIYGGETLLTTAIHAPMRHQWEASFLFHLLGGSQDQSFVPLLAERPDLPVLGICLGMQTLNVATGGTLTQDIPSEIYGVSTFEAVKELPVEQHHRNVTYFVDRRSDTRSYGFHPVKVSDRQGLFEQLEALGAPTAAGPVAVLSSHHQAVKKLGLGLVPVATSTDGKVIEAVQHQTFPNVAGVQFHPESRLLWNVDRGGEQSDRPAPGAPSYRETLHADAQSLAFHRAFWRLLSSRVKNGATAAVARGQ